MKRSSQYKRISILQLLITIGAVILVNLLFSQFYQRFDLTKEKRYTISTASKSIINDLDDIVFIKIYLAGELPADYQRFQNEIRDLLAEYRDISGRQIEYEFIDPFDQPDVEEANKFVRTLMEKGLEVRQVSQQSLEEFSQKMIIPGALVSYRGREVAVNLLPNQNLGEDPANVITAGISTLEYNISNALRKLQQERRSKILFSQGHGELDPAHLNDIAVTLQQQQYVVDLLDLPGNVSVPFDTDVLIIAKPRAPFSEQDKFKIDQFVMSGGKVLWLIDALNAELDSLLRQQGQVFITQQYELNLDDILFQYGARVNDDLVQDMQNLRIPLYAGNTQQPTFYPWPFFPIIFPQGNHPINKHLEAVFFKFVSSVDTVGAPDIQKTVLINTSNQSRLMYNPIRVSLSQATIRPEPQQFNKSDIPLAVLLEGQFTSIFRNRLPEDFIKIYQDSLNKQYREQSVPTKMIVIGDGDMIANDVGRQGPMKLGQYRYNPNYIYANKNFILNSIDYLVDNYGLISTRTKEFKTRPLNKTELRDNIFRWQVINLILPILALVIFAFIYNYIRRRKYASTK